MPQVAIVYTSTTGNTRYVAELIQRHFGEDNAVLIEAHHESLGQLVKFKKLICCVSTWGRGDMQDDWETLAPRINEIDLKGVAVGVVGLGDQKNYPRAFADGARHLADLMRTSGARTVGKTSTEGYTFTFSAAVEDGKFLGLVIDEDNQHSLTETRVKDWVLQLQREHGF